MIHTEVPRLDQLLQDHARALGADLVAYRNHCYRVLNRAVHWAAVDDAESLDKLAVAIAFHDLGIWTDATFDYLPPSEQRAQVWLAEQGLSAWADEIVAIIREHHRCRPYTQAPSRLVEALRRADWADVSLGLFGTGLPAADRKALAAAFPNAGFHRRLLQLGGRRLLSHPLSPLPMLRW